MGMKPRGKANTGKFTPGSYDPSNLSKEDLKEICSEMSGLLIWMLKFAKVEGIMFDGNTLSPSGDIKERTFDALDSIGYVVDREEYYKQQDKKKRRR